MTSFKSVMLYPDGAVETENRKGTAGFLPIGPISPTINMENSRISDAPKLDPAIYLDMTETLNVALSSNEPKIVHQGWLKKQKTSGFIRGWKQRWCVFYEGGTFRYYSEAPKELDLEFGGDEKYRKGKGDVSFSRLKSFGIDGHTFWLGTNKRIWRFAATNSTEAAIWFDVLTKPHLEYEAARQESLQTVSFFDTASDLSLTRPPTMSMMFRCPTPSKSNRLSFSAALEQMRQCHNPQTYDAVPTTPSGRSFGRSFTMPELSALEDENEDDEILKAGWLQKQGGRFGFWKRRWCELYKDGTFRYWTSPDKRAKQRKGKGDVSFRIIKASGQDAQEFWVETPKRVWIFQAENCIEAAEWLQLFYVPQELNTKKKVVTVNSKYQLWARTQSLTEDDFDFDDIRMSICTDYLEALVESPDRKHMHTPKACEVKLDMSLENEFIIPNHESPSFETQIVEVHPNTTRISN